MFDALSARFAKTFGNLRSKGKISASDVDSVIDEITSALLEADVAKEVVDLFTDRIRIQANTLLPTLQAGSNQAQAIFDVVNSELITILGTESRRIRFSKNPPTVLMLAGLQGAGKTTLAAKLAKFYKDQGNTPLLVAADLQRPNAVTQLQVLGEQIGVPVFAPELGNGSGSAVQVARDGLTFAKSKVHNMVIVDTAGRLGVDDELMDEAISIRDEIKPHEILFVIDAMIGQSAIATARAFDKGVGFDGLVLTKLDGDARGGAALSITEIIKRPIMFVSTGEKISDFDLFHPDRMASRILGLGDVATLAEQAKKALNPETSAKLEEKFARGDDFTLEDFLEQLEAMANMGSMGKLLSMLPGAASMKKQIENFDESEIVRTKAIVQSMTPRERRDVKLLNGTRRSRIALGSGRAVSEVNSLVERFTAAQKAMKLMRSGSLPAGMPPGMGAGMGHMPIAKAPVVHKKKSKSGNPAKRAAEERG
jgi:signal recognition particle subunit SRP54